MKKESRDSPKKNRKLTPKENVFYFSFLIITVASIYLIGFWIGIVIGIILFFTAGYISNKELAREEKAKVSNNTLQNTAAEIYINDDKEFKYPHLKKLELAIQEASRTKKSADFSDLIQDYTKEEWEYLSNKYPRLSIPVTNPLHKFHAKYSTLYASLKDKIQENKRVCLDEYEEKNLRAFCELDGLTLSNVIRPVTIDTLIAGLPYHDYKLKKVKEILDQSPYQKLQFEVEPTNPYDSKAVKIKLNEFFLGYVPQIYSSVVFDAISNNEDVSVTLFQYEKSKKIENRITVSIEIFYK
ncbi:hypothetical protein QM480_01890 [Flectobacillus sp. DC10W]|uniref:HIRAN domain-containing protein n=1 Tax=Flectobacillus longus TaxID=2984207 RepID=A0ABT6YHJ2_9BACT|nr:HIRAN domain-containing protein [Flectobacillus longus]MDI9863061.1 hypothetical protein [Flectobacillus longus]